MRIALHSVIAEGAVDAYRTAHARIPDDLRDLFDAAGIHEWIIWRSGRNLFHAIDCDDFDRAMAIVDASAANVAWQTNIGRFVEGFLGPDGEVAFAPLEEVWSLTDQSSPAS
jgi:L-rhamnose mutarotase